MLHDVTDRFIHFIVTHAGAVTAGIASIVGPAAAVAAQSPIEQSGINPQVVALILSIGPPLSWFCFRVLRSVSEYFAVVDKRKRERANSYLADESLTNDDKAREYLDEADKAAALAAAFKMVSAKKGDSDEGSAENEKAKK